MLHVSVLKEYKHPETFCLSDEIRLNLLKAHNHKHLFPWRALQSAQL